MFMHQSTNVAPTDLLAQNTFSECLGPFVPNFHSLFVPDFLHEWELGVWKNLMIHLIRILHAESEVRVRDFNERCVWHVSPDIPGY